MSQSMLDTYEGDLKALGDDAVVVAPCSGKLNLDPAFIRPGAVVYRGEVVGRIIQRRGCQTVVSRFTGIVERTLVEPGSKVRASQPVIWLRKI
ncbi:MAG: hypothetical protein C4318_05685 [Acidimicrobiia bacterium]